MHAMIETTVNMDALVVETLIMIASRSGLSLSDMAAAVIDDTEIPEYLVRYPLLVPVAGRPRRRGGMGRALLRPVRLKLTLDQYDKTLEIRQRFKKSVSWFLEEELRRRFLGGGGVLN